METTNKTNRHFELTSETLNHNGVTLYRIKALKDIKPFVAKKGELGGWVESEKNILGDFAWVGDEAKVYGDAVVTENAEVLNYAEVFDNAVIQGKAVVKNNARVYGNAVIDSSIIKDNAKVNAEARVEGLSEVTDDALVSGFSVISGTAKIMGNAIINGDQVCISSSESIGEDAYIESEKDYISLTNYCPNSTLTFFKTREGSIKVGHWNTQYCTLDELDSPEMCVMLGLNYATLNPLKELIRMRMNQVTDRFQIIFESMERMNNIN